MCENHEHDFEARYDIKMPPPARMPKGCISVELAEAVKETIHVLDVCVRCGKTVERRRDY